MSRYTVLITYSAPLQQRFLHQTVQVSGQVSSIKLTGGSGLLMVDASRVRGESATEAVVSVMNAFEQSWDKSRGQLSVRSWTTHRERVLIGGRRRRGRVTAWNNVGWTDGGSGDDRPDDEGGSAGVREPRRPLPGPGSLTAALELPGPERPTSP